MSAHSESEKRALNDGGHPPKQSDHAKEFKHLKIGVWDVYEQVPPKGFGNAVPGISKFTRGLGTFKDLPFFWRVLKDIAGIKSCWYYLGPFILVKVLLSLQPAVALWCGPYVLPTLEISLTPKHSGLPRITLPLFVLHRTCSLLLTKSSDSSGNR